MLTGLSRFSFAIFLLVSSCLLGQRLPQGVRPEHYTLKLTPDLHAATFTGEETIDVTLEAPSRTVTLNAIEIKFGDVSAAGNPATVTLDEAKQQAKLTFARPLPAGKNSIRIAYSGILNNELRGFYLSKTEKRNYAVTQFEATDARRAFPSFDEPAMKATFDVTLVVDANDTAISNTNIVADTPEGAGKHALKFATTPKMSTYLVAFLVGDFKCVEGKSDGVPIRACATPDKVQYGKLAVESAEYILHYYNQYFGIPYPLPKLDMIALPDFEAGAMENFGAITYRETALLADEKTASLNQKKTVANVVAHEMAHQWFGDMVTMQWWDNLWLNEGFATWMEAKPVAAWKPEWHISEDEAVGLDRTMALDAQKRTRTIRATAETPEQINEMFDGITYGKAGAVIGMVENYVGEETFRKGVHNYLAAHIYGNATAEDFWGAQTAASGKPIDRVMSSFVVQPGVPLVQFSPAQEGKIGVAQQRFFAVAGATGGSNQAWALPLCLTARETAYCNLIDGKQASVPALKEATEYYGNAKAKGYYRSLLAPEDLKRLAADAETVLKPEERILLAGDEWALVRADRTSVADFLSLVPPLSVDRSETVLDTVAAGLNTIDQQIASEKDQPAFAAWVRQVFEPAYEKIQAQSDNDSLDVKTRRARLLEVLGLLGKDPGVIGESNKLAEQWTRDAGSVDPVLAEAALSVASANGGPQLFDTLQHLYKTANDPQVRTRSLYLLAEFNDPALVRRALDYAVSGEVRNQDAIRFFLAPLSRRQTRTVAWAYVKDNWDKVHAMITPLTGGRLVNATGSFCSAQAKGEVDQFFTAHPVESAERARQRADDQIDACVSLREAQQPKLSQWLAGQNLSASRGN